MFSWMILQSVEDPTVCGDRCSKTSIHCNDPQAHIERFKKSLAKAGIEGGKMPKQWLCYPFVSHVMSERIRQSVESGSDPLYLIAGRRDIRRRRKGRIEFLQEQTEQNLPDSLFSVSHLEAQGYLCFYCQVDATQIRYWFEHPKTGWVAMLHYDVGAQRITDRLVTSKYPLAFSKIHEKGVF